MWHSEMEGIGVDDGHGNDGGSLRRWCWRVKTAAVWKGEVGGVATTISHYFPQHLASTSNCFALPARPAIPPWVRNFLKYVP